MQESECNCRGKCRQCRQDIKTNPIETNSIEDEWVAQIQKSYTSFFQQKKCLMAYNDGRKYIEERIKLVSRLQVGDTKHSLANIVEVSETNFRYQFWLWKRMKRPNKDEE